MKTITLLISVLILFGCSGTDTVDVDNTPPTEPTIHPHQGDTGDIVTNEGVGIDTLNFYQLGDSVFNWEDENENNGIDAVSVVENAIQIQWNPLTDSDLSYIHVYRFNSIDDDTLRIATENPDKTSFTDRFTEYVGSVTGKDWFYYIDVFDEAGNHTVSDTVCYHLLEKPQLTSPQNGISVNNINDITFRWNKSESDDILDFRLLVFDTERNLLWINRPTDTVEGTEIVVPYEGPPISAEEIIWRVDAFGDTKTMEINGTEYVIPAGSESEERNILINQ